MDAAESSEKLLPVYQTIQCQIPEDHYLDTVPCKSLLGNSPVNTFQHRPSNNEGTCIFYAMTSSTTETVFSVILLQSAYKSIRMRMEYVLSELRRLLDYILEQEYKVSEDMKS
jgi:hypothetical protein